MYWRENKFKWDDEVMAVLKQKFGHNDLRENQKGIINATMDGKDCMGLIPTGGGKSLTFQIPAVLSKGVTIVVMPLLALINDQVTFCAVHDIPCIELTTANPCYGQK